MATVNIESLDNRPWIPHHIPNALRREFFRRTLDEGINYINSSTSMWTDASKKYKGPLSPWMRITSNGTGISKNIAKTLSLDEIEKKKRDGFILYGGQGFKESYGFMDPKKYNTNVIGYDVNGKEHKLNILSDAKSIVTLDNNKTTPQFLPPPGVTSIESSIQKERIRKVVINWKCHGFAQLEYLTPYLLTPGISVIAEFGWNHFNNESLLDLKDKNKLIELFHDGTPLYDRILASNGMYDVTFGIIANFEFSSQNGVTYDCKTEIYSKHRNHTGAFLNEAPKITDNIDSTGKPQTSTKRTFYDFCNTRLKKITKCLVGNGLNFFDPLDDSEKKNLNSKDLSLKNKFFNGKPENRICMARGIANDDPFSLFLPHEHDWDKESPDEVWVTMGFVIELFNLFIGQEIETTKATDTSDVNNFKLYSIDIDDVIIGAHPNLISCDGSTILIPNSAAPKFNLGSKYWLEDYIDRKTGEIDINGAERNKLQTQTYSKADDSFSTTNKVNKKLYSVFKTGYAPGLFTNSSTSNDIDSIITNIKSIIVPSIVKEQKAGLTTEGSYRDNIDSFINRFRYKGPAAIKKGEASFPRRDDYIKNGNSYKGGYWGYLKDIYINVNMLIDIVHNSKTSGEFLETLLNRISGAAAGFWELSVVEDEKKLRIIDKKLISNNLYNNIFQMDISSDSFIKSVSFTANPSNAQMNQVIAGSSNNQNKNTGVATSNELPDFYFGDRLGANQIIPDKVTSYINESSNIIKQFQKYGKVPGAYIVSLKSPEPSKHYRVYNLALPNSSLLLSILNCDDQEDNTNIYGGQQPNFVCEISMQGIAGLRTFQCFSIKNLPKPYSELDIIFQIVDVSHILLPGEWTTTIKAGIRSVRRLKVIPTDGREAFDMNELKLKLENKS